MVIGLQFCNRFPCFGIGEPIPISQFPRNVASCSDLLNRVITISGLCRKSCFKIRVGKLRIPDGL